MGKKNLADPKRRQGQAQNVQATQYDDDDGGRGSVPPRGPLPPRAGGTPSRGRPPSRMRSEDRTPSSSPRLNSYASRRPPPPQHFAEGTLSRGQPPSRMRSKYCTPSLSRGPPTRGRPLHTREVKIVHNPLVHVRALLIKIKVAEHVHNTEVIVTPHLPVVEVSLRLAANEFSPKKRKPLIRSATRAGRRKASIYVLCTSDMR
jgi:hypothetical protein